LLGTITGWDKSSVAGGKGDTTDTAVFGYSRKEVSFGTGAILCHGIHNLLFVQSSLGYISQIVSFFACGLSN